MPSKGNNNSTQVITFRLQHTEVEKLLKLAIAAGFGESLGLYVRDRVLGWFKE